MGQPSLNEEDVKRLMEEQPEEVERLVKEINAMKQAQANFDSSMFPGALAAFLGKMSNKPEEHFIAATSSVVNGKGWIGEKPKMAAKASEVFEAADHLYNAAFLACHPEYEDKQKLFLIPEINTFFVPLKTGIVSAAAVPQKVTEKHMKAAIGVALSLNHILAGDNLISQLSTPLAMKTDLVTRSKIPQQWLDLGSEGFAATAFILAVSITRPDCPKCPKSHRIQELLSLMIMLAACCLPKTVTGGLLDRLLSSSAVALHSLDDAETSIHSSLTVLVRELDDAPRLSFCRSLFQLVVSRQVNPYPNGLLGEVLCGLALGFDTPFFKENAFAILALSLALLDGKDLSLVPAFAAIFLPLNHNVVWQIVDKSLAALPENKNTAEGLKHLKPTLESAADKSVRSVEAVEEYKKKAHEETAETEGDEPVKKDSLEFMTSVLHEMFHLATGETGKHDETLKGGDQVGVFCYQALKDRIDSTRITFIGRAAK